MILSWNGTKGIPFEYASLSGIQQNALTAGDSAGAACNSTTGYAVQDRLNYLRGDRSCEINSSGVGLFRRRTSVLADIVDSSPTWVGVPDASYTAVWNDRINSADPLSENSGTAQTYPAYVTAEQNRQQVVYVGANDGLLHGFRSGTYNAATGTYTNNDGYELLAYMPGAVVQNSLAANPGVQVIHSNSNTQIDYSNSQYGHDFWVDATPGTGDVFFNGQWHTWLVGGLGPAGAAIYALDVTNPANFSEGNAASLVIGEWNSSTITCVGSATCGTNLGNTYGTPQIRRLHDGKWAIIFGNGIGSQSGDAGIYVGVLNTSTGAPTFYYLSSGCLAAHTCSAGTPSGIAFATPVDLDGDHITDYVYAGDIQGNLWRFDLTSATETNWAVTPGPLFKTPAGQPITTTVVAASGAPNPGMEQQLMLLFGTGQKFPLTERERGHLRDRHAESLRRVGLEHERLERALDDHAVLEPRRRIDWPGGGEPHHGAGEPAGTDGHDQQLDRGPRHQYQRDHLLGRSERLHRQYCTVRLVSESARHPGAGHLQSGARGAGADG